MICDLRFVCAHVDTRVEHYLASSRVIPVRLLLLVYLYIPHRPHTTPIAPAENHLIYLREPGTHNYCPWVEKTRYCTSLEADEVLYSHCPKQYREANYRMQMVLRELRGYGADLLMLQVC